MSRLSYCSYSLYICSVTIIAYYNLPAEGLLLLGVLLMFDVVMGVGKSYVLSGHEKGWFSSSKMQDGIIAKATLFTVAILIGIITSFLIKSEQFSIIFSDVVIGLFIAAEMISILQNAIMIRTKEQLDERDAITAVLRFLLREIRRVINTKIK